MGCPQRTRPAHSLPRTSSGHPRMPADVLRCVHVATKEYDKHQHYHRCSRLLQTLRLEQNRVCGPLTTPPGAPHTSEVYTFPSWKGCCGRTKTVTHSAATLADTQKDSSSMHPYPLFSFTLIVDTKREEKLLPTGSSCPQEAPARCDAVACHCYLQLGTCVTSCLASEVCWDERKMLDSGLLTRHSNLRNPYRIHLQRVICRTAGRQRILGLPSAAIRGPQVLQAQQRRHRSLFNV